MLHKIIISFLGIITTDDVNINKNTKKYWTKIYFTFSRRRTMIYSVKSIYIRR